VTDREWQRKLNDVWANALTSALAAGHDDPVNVAHTATELFSNHADPSLYLAPEENAADLPDAPLATIDDWREEKSAREYYKGLCHQVAQVLDKFLRDQKVRVTGIVVGTAAKPSNELTDELKRALYVALRIHGKAGKRNG